jgi:hypothetical protein
MGTEKGEVKMGKKGLWLYLAVFLVGVGIVASAQEKSSNRVVSERFIVKIDSSSWVPKSFRVSPDSKHVVYVAKVGRKWSVVIDGKEGKQYVAIGTIPIFSPDGKRVAYVAEVDRKWFVVVDGKEGKRYDFLGTTLIFSPDSKRVAYVAKEGDKKFVVVDGKEGKRYVSIGTIPVFSPDSKHLAYVAEADHKQLVVVDGQEGKEYAGIINIGRRKIIFNSPNAFHYLAVRGGNRIYLVNERIK